MLCSPPACSGAGGTPDAEAPAAEADSEAEFSMRVTQLRGIIDQQSRRKEELERCALPARLDSVIRPRPRPWGTAVTLAWLRCCGVWVG